MLLLVHHESGQGIGSISETEVFSRCSSKTNKQKNLHAYSYTHLLQTYCYEGFVDTIYK